uniref:Uncharacterized protein n=1 Tax=Arundo donax TaxID=35708 RepID=A0A0A9CBE8_ARUDO
MLAASCSMCCITLYRWLADDYLLYHILCKSEYKY